MQQFINYDLNMLGIQLHGWSMLHVCEALVRKVRGRDHVVKHR